MRGGDNAGIGLSVNPLGGGSPAPAMPSDFEVVAPNSHSTAHTPSILCSRVQVQAPAPFSLSDCLTCTRSRVDPGLERYGLSSLSLVASGYFPKFFSPQ